MQKKIQRIAVVGAGVSGLSVASCLAAAGREVRVFEKSRGLGGRLAVRRVDGIGAFDIGAQFMTAESAAFRNLLEAAMVKGEVAPWRGKMVFMSEDGILPASQRQRYVGVPAMNSWVKDLFPSSQIELGRTVSHLSRTAHGMWCLDHDDAMLFDGVILAIPAPQARSLAEPTGVLNTDTLSFLRQAIMEPCWCVYAAFDHPVAVPFDAAFVRQTRSPFSWLARNSSKPGRDQTRDHWVLHATPAWTQEHFEVSAADVEDKLLAAFAALAPETKLAPRHIGSHRWRYASPPTLDHRGIHWDHDSGLGVVGDWSFGGRVEGAFLAGREMAEAILTLPQS